MKVSPMNIPRLISVYVLAFISIAISTTAQAQVKKCTDSKGKVTYTQAVCPQATAKDKTIMAYTPVSSAQPSTASDWKAENKAFNQRQAQRNHLESVENRNRAAIAAFDKATSKPLAPGESRRTTLYLTKP
jgi:hypothetical protein